MMSASAEPGPTVYVANYQKVGAFRQSLDQLVH
jgi:hypothetical protein